MRVEPIPERFVHIDVLIAVVAEKLAAVCVDLSRGRSSVAARKGFELIEVSAEDAFTLGVNAISLGDDRVLTGARARAPERADAGPRASSVYWPRTWRCSRWAAAAPTASARRCGASAPADERARRSTPAG